MRVLVVGSPGLLHDMVTDAVRSQPDMTLLPHDVAASGSLSVAQRTDAEAIVYLIGAREPGPIEAVLRKALPRRAVLAIRESGEHAGLYDYDLHVAAELRGDLSPRALLDEIRRCVQRWRSA
jgi:hypothetical protein